MEALGCNAGDEQRHGLAECGSLTWGQSTVVAEKALELVVRGHARRQSPVLLGAMLSKWARKSSVLLKWRVRPAA
jgi:hypothetical protein